MQIKSNYKGVTGSMFLYNRMLRLRHMDEEEINRRIRIIKFSLEFGLKAASQAFEINEKTIRRWKLLLKQGEGKLEKLSPKSKRPKSLRKRIVEDKVLEEIIRLRKEHFQLGKRKLYPLLVKLLPNIQIPNISTIGRILQDLKKRGLIPSHDTLSYYAKEDRLKVKIIRKRKKLRKSKGESVFEVYTVVRHFNGIKLYTITGIDTDTRIAFAKSYFNHSSISTREFILECASKILISKVQTDNGSEFAKHFEQTLTANDIVQYFTYPRSPKMNAHIERFNRTLDEEFIKWNRYRAIMSLDDFNIHLSKYIKWYNEERPHASLGYLSPKENLIRLGKVDICMWT